MPRRGGSRLVLIAPLPPPYGGVSVHVERLRELLLENGIAHTTLSMRPGAAPPGVRSVSYRGPDWPAALAHVARAARLGGVLHNHTSLLMYPMPNRLQTLFALTRGLRIRRIEHAYDATLPERFAGFTREQRHLVAAGLRGAERVVAIGPLLRDFIVELGVPEARVAVARCLLPPRDARPPLPPSLASLVARHPAVWTAIGAGIPLYDFHTVAQAFRRHAADDPAAGLVLVSGGFASDPAYERELRELLAPLAERSLIVTDLSNGEVQALLGASAVMIRGAKVDSFGLSRIEAILAGTPVVTTPNPPLEHMEVYEHGDPESLLAAVHRALREGSLDIEAGRAHYLEVAHATWRLYLEIYEELGVAVR